MAESTASGATPEGAAVEPSPRSSSAMLIRITVLLFVVAVIGAECLVASLCMPAGPAPSTSATASRDQGPKSGTSETKASHPEKDKSHPEKDKKGKKEKKGGHEKEPPAAEADDATSAEQVEVDLEQFSVTAHQPASNTTTRIEFHLYGIVNTLERQ